MIPLWDRANQIIPGGNHLFSKTPDRYAPGKWPPYYLTATGITIEATDGKTYKDFSVMGAGNSVLGYGDHDVDGAVGQAIVDGNVSTLNCIEEVELAVLMLKLNPDMDMVRFGRSGNDACQIALRIAQEYSGCKKFAICGYHGWQIGHPPQLHPDCVPFEYGDLDGFLEALKYLPGTVMMEPVRGKPIDTVFLEVIREYTEDLGIVLIFDEVASGFRQNLGGIYQSTRVVPDIALFGKAMGNGYAISAVVGQQEVMEAALNTFISSMQWSERLGYAAGWATIHKMKEVHAQEQMCRIGATVKGIWAGAAKEAGIDIEISGLDPLATFTFVNNPDVTRTIFTQEMLKRGYLASNQFYASVKHTQGEIAPYQEAVTEVFADIAAGKAVLEGKVAKAGFKRLA